VFQKPAKIRYHPSALPPGMKRSKPLSETYDETYVSVSYDSNCAVQTVIAGVPTVLQSPRAVAFPMCSSEMGVVTPDRESWVHDLSHREYDIAGREELDDAARFIKAQYIQAGPLTESWATYGIKEPT
jgi:hypothetical protein